MCGIAGIVNVEGAVLPGRELLKRMCDVIAHRGPDDEGFYFSPNVGLGIRRLSIIDLETGHQPIFNEDGTIAVVLNGEIYNYRELRRMLASRGHQFSTASDTEAIVHLYEEYGDECMNRLRGMFCFALWDEKRQRLLLARDRVGIKQVYYAERDGRLLFGSEIKCILRDRDFSRRINLQALAAYLTFLYVPYPATIFEGIFELPPAHYLVWERGRSRLQRYWRLEYHTEPERPERYYVEGLRDRLATAVSSHLIADVPLGAFLSGGIDSGSVVALMSQVANGPVETFTIGFEGKYGLYDEREDARRVAERYRTHHREFLVRPDVSNVLPQIVWALDQPLADSSVIPSYYVCQMARTCVTVALSAMGGDEMAGGYERYLGVMLGDHYRNLPEAPRRAVSRLARSLPDLGGKGRFSTARLKRFLRSAERDLAGAYFQLLATFDRGELGRILADDQKAELGGFVPEELVREAFRRSESHGVVNQMLFADLNAYLPCDLLPLTDRMSMVHSLEVRVPFLDHELLEFAATIPPELKIRRLTKKYILRKAVAELLPREQFRKSKRGFSIPLAFWLRNELRPFVGHQLSPRRIQELGYFDPRYVSTLLEEHLSARENHENKIWALLVFSIWHELYMNGASSECLASSAREAGGSSHGR